MKATEHIEYLLKQGRKTKELLELGFSKAAITRAKRKLRKERSLKKSKATEKVTATKGRANSLSKQPGHTEAPELKQELTENQWGQINDLLNALPELASLMAAVRQYGIDEREVCPHEENGVCTLLTWDSEVEIPGGIGEPVATDGENPQWHIKPSIYYCALCTARIERHLDRIETEALDTFFWQVREQIPCRNCGSKGWIAIPVKCTKCGQQSYCGWYPKEE